MPVSQPTHTPACAYIHVLKSYLYAPSHTHTCTNAITDTEAADPDYLSQPLRRVEGRALVLLFTVDSFFFWCISSSHLTIIYQSGLTVCQGIHLLLLITTM